MFDAQGSRRLSDASGSIVTREGDTLVVPLYLGVKLPGHRWTFDRTAVVESVADPIRAAQRTQLSAESLSALLTALRATRLEDAR